MLFDHKQEGLYLLRQFFGGKNIKSWPSSVKHLNFLLIGKRTHEQKLCLSVGMEMR